MHLWALLLTLLASQTPSWGTDHEAFPDVGKNDAGALQEASRVLEEELKLAARSQAYLVIDLVARTIAIKARGVSLYDIPVRGWSASAIDQLGQTFQLEARPPILRPKIDPTSTAEREPIALADMPTEYLLAFTPTLRVEVTSAAGGDLPRWAWSYGKRWWRDLGRWIRSFVGGQAAQTEPFLQLTLSREHSQSLAWSLVDGMALVVRRPVDQQARTGSEGTLPFSRPLHKIPALH
jgi:hypothetical protein